MESITITVRGLGGKTGTLEKRIIITSFTLAPVDKP